MPLKKITLLEKENYLAMVKNSAGVKLFRNCYGLADGGKKDLTQNGELSCAYFVSSILRIFGLIKSLHLTVEGTIKDMEKSGWKKTKKMEAGDILIWEEKNSHRHIGFYLGNKKAISNSPKTKSPQIHSVGFGGQRKIEAIYRRL